MLYPYKMGSNCWFNKILSYNEKIGLGLKKKK